MTPHPDDTIVALSSAPGPGLRAIVRVSGPRTQAVVGRVFTPSAGEPPASRGRLAGSLRLTDVHSLLPADLYLWPGPRSYTGQDLAEIHTLSSPPLVERLIADLIAAGARAAHPGEFTQRAFLAGKLDLTRAEAVLAVIEAGTETDLKQALAQLAGGVAKPLHALREDLLDLLADVEAGLDFVDEDISFVGKTELLTRIAAGLAHLTNLRRQLDDRAVGGRPVRVAIVGEPNAGKSSLFNALAGTPAALTGPRPGTTRDFLTHRLELGGVPVELIDTAGWQHETDTIAEQAQRLGREQARRADVLLWCAPVGSPFPEETEAVLRPAGAEISRAWTKTDTRHETRDTCETSFVSRVSCLVSVVTPGGLDELKTALTGFVTALARPALAPSQSRCRGHVELAFAALRRAHEHALYDDPQELLALALREALAQIGELVGAVYTNDLLDRIFSRFCIGK
jgi:tRNA modification GTPase